MEREYLAPLGKAPGNRTCPRALTLGKYGADTPAERMNHLECLLLDQSSAELLSLILLH